jgi:HPt (histidine-containing phosphotransfer) domain-containing protein
MAEENFIFVNLDYIKSMAGDNEELIREMAEIFVQQIPEFNELFNTLYEKGDYHNLGMQAHKAKSSVAIMGMDDLAVMLKEFELLAKEGKETDKYPDYIRRFREETAGAIEELSRHFSL